MKKDTHPAYGAMKVTLSNGDVVEINSVLGAKEGYEMKLDVDSLNHPAYTKSKDSLVVGSSQRNKFEGRFAAVMGAKPAAKKAEVKVEAPKEEVVAEEAPKEEAKTDA